MIELNGRTFKENVLDEKGLVVVDCNAVWCSPCRMMHPVLEDLSEEYKDRATIVSLNVDENPKTAAEFGIRNIPTILFFKNAIVIDKIVGAVSKNIIKNKIEEHLQ